MKVHILVFALVTIMAEALCAQMPSSTIRYTNMSAIEKIGADSLTANQREAMQQIAKGNAYHDNGMFHDAIKCYKAADSLFPGNATVNYELGYSFMMLKQLDSAVFYAKRSIEIEPGELSFSLVGDVFDYMGVVDSALKYYDLGLSFYPKSYHLLYNKGVALFTYKRVDEAFIVARQSVKYTRQHEGSYFLMAQISAKKGLWIDFFANGLYANFVGNTNGRMDYVTKYFRELMFVFARRMAIFDEEVLNRPLLDIHRNWASSTVYRFIDSHSTFGKNDYNLLDSLENDDKTYEILVDLGSFAMRESVKLPYDFELKPFYKQIVEGGFEDLYMRIVFRNMNQVAFDSWKMMNEKRFKKFYDTIVFPFWNGEQSLKAPVLIERPN